MKYPQSVPMTRDVQDWLEGELDARGIDASVYTQHILPLLQPHRHTSKGAWSSRIVEGAGFDLWRLWDDEALKRLNVVRCLMSASNQKCDIVSLVSDLCAKLDEIQKGAASADNTFPKCDYTPPFTADFFDCGLAPSREGLERGGETLATTGWARGLLRASLDQSNFGLFYDDNINIEDCFSIMQCGQKTSYGHVGGVFPGCGREDEKRLYERAANTAKVIEPAPPDQVNQYDCFFNSNFSPGFFAFGGGTQEQQSQVSWSLGGVIPSLGNPGKVNNCFQNVEEPAGIAAPRHTTQCPPAPPEEDDENLLTSARTHFRPICSDEEPMKEPTRYADGTSFVISNELENPQFERSESGSLFLHSGKYFEYKYRDEIGINDNNPDEFIPKFKVMRKEKFCQTDDLDEEILPTEDRVVPTASPCSTHLSDEGVFYFPGDDDLARNLDSEDLPTEDEIVRIVSGRWQGVGDVVDNALLPSDPELVDINDIDNNWDAEVASSLANANAVEVHDDSEMDGEISGSSTEPPVWPMLTTSIWNPRNACYSCGHGDSAEKPLMDSDWREIWGRPLCNDCKIRLSEKTTEGVVNSLLKTGKGDSISSDLDVVTNIAENVRISQIWSSSSSLSTEEKSVDLPDDYNFGQPTFSDGSVAAFFAKRRDHAMEMIHNPIWSPFQQSAVRMPRELRGYWSPITSSEDDGSTLPPSECRDRWSPASLYAKNERAATYSMLREELSEDGDQLLSDLSCLHLEQVVTDEATDASDVPDDDSFPTAPPSPDWEMSRWVDWDHGCKSIVEDNQKQDERTYNPETAQKERKRRNSSSQKVCELYLEGECRKPHCRFLHCDAAVPCPFYDDASCLKGDACPLSHAPRLGRDMQRAFTL